MKKGKNNEYRSRVYTDRPSYADLDAPQKFQAIEGIVASKLGRSIYRPAICSYSGGFDHKAFYDWVASCDFPVYFSSYQNISDKRFKMIWAAGKVNLLAGASGQEKNYECIYTNK